MDNAPGGDPRTAVTRGYGVLEGFLARQRVAVANRLIPGEKRSGSILDIGCSEHPYFLLHTDFSERCGLDRIVDPRSIDTFMRKNVALKNHDVEAGQALPFDSGRFDVVTMLAVLEHVEPQRVPVLLGEVRRLLKPEGLFILTTPAAWADRLLRLLASVHLVSPVEIAEHKAAYTPSGLVAALAGAGFDRDRITTGSFELHLNLWATARKE